MQIILIILLYKNDCYTLFDKPNKHNKVIVLKIFSMLTNYLQNN